MKLIQGYSYTAKSKEEAQEIVDKLEKLGIKSLGRNNWTQDYNVLEVTSLGNSVNFYKVAAPSGAICTTFEEWCERSIEGYKKSTEKRWDQKETITIKDATFEESKEIQKKLFDLGYKWIGSGKSVISYNHFKVRSDKILTSTTEPHYQSFTGKEFLQILRDMGALGTSCSPYSTEDSPYKVEQTELGTKYTFKNGYKGDFKFDIGAEVIVHTGSNDEKTERKGKIIRNIYGGVTNNLCPFIELDTGDQCYPLYYRDLVVTVLKEKPKPVVTSTPDKYWNGKKIVTKDNAYVGMKVVRGRDWRWNEQDRDSLYGEIVKIFRAGKFSFEVSWKDKYGKVTRSQLWYRGKNVFDLCEYKETSSDSSSSTPYINNYVPTEFAVKMKDTVEQCFDTIAESVQKGKKARMNLSLLSEEGKIEVKLKTSEKNNKQKLNLKLI